MSIDLSRSGILPWLILAVLAAMQVAGMISDYLAARYQVSVSPPGRVRVTRRWYGTGARVFLRGSPARHLVLGWGGEYSRVPWLLVQDIDDEDAPGSFWGPVTDFAPCAVRRFRPHVLRSGRLRVPGLFDYRPLRQPAGYLQDGA